jgi:hypothetical protein
MRTVLLLSPLALAACNADCGSPEQVNGRYAVFANVLSFDGDNLDGFPSYQDPANGWSEWEITWTNIANGRVTVLIDGEEFDGDGAWDDVECGNFSLRFAGVYASDIGSTHDFTTTGQLVRFADRLEGTFTWSEEWAYDGDDGTFDADGQLAGDLIR